MNNNKINVKDIEIVTFQKNDFDFISLTDMARYKNADEPRFVIQNWMKARYVIEFLGNWELLYNSNFNRVNFDTFKNEAGNNYFVLTPDKWIKATNAIGIQSKAGRYGDGTFAHKDIAFEFASRLSPVFKLYLIKEFQRLKNEENERLALGWDVKRLLTKVNYKIHTDAIKTHIIFPRTLSKKDEVFTYASEADVLNMALYGMTAKQWKEANPKLPGNIRDYITKLHLLIEFRNQYIERYAKVHKKSWQVDTQQFKRYAKTWENRKLSSISKSHIQKLHAEIGATKGHYAANRLLALLHTMFNRAIDWGWDGANPAHGIKKFKEQSRDRFIQSDEMPKFFQALSEETSIATRDIFFLVY